MMYAIGLDIGGTTLKLGIVRDGEEIVYRDTQPSVHEAVRLARAASGISMGDTALKSFR